MCSSDLYSHAITQSVMYTGCTLVREEYITMTVKRMICRHCTIEKLAFNSCLCNKLIIHDCSNVYLSLLTTTFKDEIELTNIKECELAIHSSRLMDLWCTNVCISNVIIMFSKIHYIVLNNSTAGYTDGIIYVGEIPHTSIACIESTHTKYRKIQISRC